MGSNDKTLQAFQALQAQHEMLVEQHEMLVEQHEQVSKQNKQMSKQNERMRKQLAFEDSLWQSEENKTKRVVRGRTPLRMHAIEVADGIIGDPVRLCNVTGCTKESFTIIRSIYVSHLFIFTTFISPLRVILRSDLCISLTVL